MMVIRPARAQASEQPAGGADQPGRFRRRDEDARADHRPHDQHRGVEHPEVAMQGAGLGGPGGRFGFRGRHGSAVSCDGIATAQSARRRRGFPGERGLRRAASRRPRRRRSPGRASGGASRSGRCPGPASSLLARWAAASLADLAVGPDLGEVAVVDPRSSAPWRRPSRSLGSGRLSMEWLPRT